MPHWIELGQWSCHMRCHFRQDFRITTYYQLARAGSCQCWHLMTQSGCRMVMQRYFFQDGLGPVHSATYFPLARAEIIQRLTFVMAQKYTILARIGKLVFEERSDNLKSDIAGKRIAAVASGTTHGEVTVISKAWERR